MADNLSGQLPEIPFSNNKSFLDIRWLKTLIDNQHCRTCDGGLHFPDLEIDIDNKQISVPCSNCNLVLKLPIDVFKKKIYKWRPKPTSQICGHQVIKINMFEKDPETSVNESSYDNNKKEVQVSNNYAKWKPIKESINESLLIEKVV